LSRHEQARFTACRPDRRPLRRKLQVLEDVLDQFQVVNHGKWPDCVGRDAGIYI